MKVLMVLMLSLTAMSSMAAQVETTDASAIMCQTEQAKIDQTKSTDDTKVEAGVIAN